MGSKAKPRSKTPPPLDPILVGHKEAAAFLHIAPMTLHHWNAEKRGPPVHRISPKKTLYDLRELAVWVQEGGTTPRPKRRRRRQNHNSASQPPAV